MKLDDKIRAILEGKSEDESIPDTGTLKSSDDSDGDEDNTKIKKGQQDKDSADVLSKNLSGKKDKAEVKESLVPDLGKDLSGEGKETTAGEDNAKILAGKPRKLDKGDDLKAQDSSDKQDDNGDNTRGKLKPKAAGSEAGGKLQAESIQALFAGETLSEEFKTKAEAIFEAAVTTVAEEKIEAIQEQYAVSLKEAAQELQEQLVDSIDEYLTQAVQEWSEENQVAIESGIKAQEVESFIDGIKSVFEARGVEIKQDGKVVESVEELEAEIKSLKEALDVSESKVVSLQCEKIKAELAEGLTAIQASKFESLIENVEFDSVKEFAAKAKTIRESYFQGKSINNDEPVHTKSVVEESIADEVLAALQGGELKFTRK